MKFVYFVVQTSAMARPYQEAVRELRWYAINFEDLKKA